MVRSFEHGEIEDVLITVKIFFANIPYDLHLKYEIYYQSIFVAIFELLGFNIQTKESTNQGQIDAVVKMPDTIYLFEFKLFDTAANALAQMKTRGYGEKDGHQGKTVVLVVVAFNQLNVI